MAPAFRMHVRAHGTVAKFFRALHDATKDQVRYIKVIDFSIYLYSLRFKKYQSLVHLINMYL